MESPMKLVNGNDSSGIVTLNVGGKVFQTTRQTLLTVNNTFFTSMFSGRIPTNKDKKGAIFIDRDPELFSAILHYFRTNQLPNIREENISTLKHEAVYYGIVPLIKQLEMYDNLVNKPSCGGDILFQTMLKVRTPEQLETLGPVRQLIPFDNGVLIAFEHFVNCYRLSDNFGWQCVFESGYIEKPITSVDFHFEFCTDLRFMIAICDGDIRLWSARRFPFVPNGQNLYSNKALCRRNATKLDECEELGRFSLNGLPVQSMFFIGTQLVALNKDKGRVGIWNSTRKWFVQDLKPNTATTITAFDKADSDYLFLCSEGTIYLIDMQKFPLRMKDGDLLINEFYKDPEEDDIRAISCFSCSSQRTDYFPVSEKSIEIAYGTRRGTVRILIHHPETVGQGPQLFQTVRVHLCPIRKVMLNSDYLISICEEEHVRTWSLSRFRGLISTQPGTTSHSSFQIHSFSPKAVSSGSDEPWSNIDVGPHGDKREGERQMLIEVNSRTNMHLGILYAANGQKICTIRTVDGSSITTACLMTQQDARYRQFFITGHFNGSVQVWDMTTAMELQAKDSTVRTTRPIDKAELWRHLFIGD